MKLITKTFSVALLAIALVACTGNKKQNAAPVKTVKDTVAWEGTYEGVMPAADCPGIYTLLALNDDGAYEMYQKYLERFDSFVSKGKIEWNASGDTITLLADGGLRFQVSKDALANANIALSRISPEDDLADSYTKQLVKEDKSGNNYTVEIYSDGKDTYAKIEFNDKDYILKENRENTQVREFTDGAVSLKWNVLDPAPLPNYKPTLTVDGKTYTFSQLSPVNEVYVTNDSGAPAKGFDVLYLSGEDGKSFVKLLSSDIVKCYTLPQTEASAKTAVYEKDGVSWSMDNKNTATLTLEGKTFKYAPLAAKK